MISELLFELDDHEMPVLSILSYGYYYGSIFSLKLKDG